MKTSIRNYSRFFSYFLAIIVIFLSSCNQKTEEVHAQKLQHPEWSKNLSIYEVNIRQYTEEGTFKAFAEHLPRIKELGTDILWLMPIHPIGEKNRKGTLGSYYAVKDYLAVNPDYGTEEDFQNLVNKIHELDMYVIIDWVANHSAWDNPLIESNPEWYTHNENGEIIAPVDDWTDVADFNYDVPEMQAYMTDALKYWVENFDIDGYRCDVAGMVPTEFWNNARTELDKIKPVFMLAEANIPGLHEKAFDMTYAWDMHFIWNEVAQGKKTIDDIVKKLDEEKTKFKPSDYRMYFTSNHDENSWKGTTFERLGNAAKSFAVLSVTLPGMPLIYSGQEACLDKQLEFFEKDVIDWEKECDLDQFYSTLLKLKKENPALWNGEFGGSMERIETSADDKIFAFKRVKDEYQVITILNLTNEDVQFDLKELSNNENLKDVFTSESFTTSYNLEAWDYKVFK